MYVQRNQQGQIVGAYSNLQPGYAEEWIDDNDPELLAYLNPPPPIPTEVTMRQARLALLEAGLLDDVEAAVNAIPGINGERARIEWSFSNTVKKNQPITQMLAQVIGLTPQQIDDMFTQGVLL